MQVLYQSFHVWKIAAQLVFHGERNEMCEIKRRNSMRLTRTDHMMRIRTAQQSTWFVRIVRLSYPPIQFCCVMDHLKGFLLLGLQFWNFIKKVCNLGNILELAQKWESCDCDAWIAVGICGQLCNCEVRSWASCDIERTCHPPIGYTATKFYYCKQKGQLCQLYPIVS